MLQDTELLRSLTDGGSVWGRELGTQLQSVERRSTAQLREANPVALVDQSASDFSTSRLGTLLQGKTSHVIMVIASRPTAIGSSCLHKLRYLGKVRWVGMLLHTLLRWMFRCAQIQPLHWSLYRLWRVKGTIRQGNLR